MTDPNLTAYLVTARQRWRCSHHGYSCALINPGDDYVLLTVFPRHDAARCHFPETRRICVPCWGITPLPERRADKVARTRHLRQPDPACECDHCVGARLETVPTQGVPA